MRALSRRVGVAIAASALVLASVAPAAAQEPAPLPPPNAPPPTAPGPAPSSPATDIGVAPPAGSQPGQPGQDASLQPPPPVAPKKKGQHMEKDWYGWEVLIADGVSLALMIGGTASKTGSITGVGYGSYLLAPAIVHFTHGNVGPGFGSFGLRLLVPPLAGAFGFVVGAIAGVNSAEKNAEDPITGFSNVAKSAVIGFDVGLIGGYLVVVGIDAGLLSYEKVMVDDDSVQWGRRSPSMVEQKKPSFSISPTFGADTHHGTVGVVGTW